MEFDIKSFILTFVLVESFYYGSLYVILHVAPSQVCLTSTGCIDLTSFTQLKDTLFNISFLSVSIALALCASFVRIGTYEAFKDLVQANRHLKIEMMYYFYYIFTFITLALGLILNNAEFFAFTITGFVMIAIVTYNRNMEKQRKRKH